MNLDLGQTERIEDILEKCPLDIYLCGTDRGMTPWPYRMRRLDKTTQNLVRNFERFIVDSAVQNPELTSKDALDKAVEVGAGRVVLEDVMRDMEKTVELVLNGLEVADSHRFDGEVIVPLQPPYEACYRELEGQADTYALGGMSNDPGLTRLEYARNVREIAGQEINLHGLGWGVEDTLISAVREDPDLLDSIDMSTPLWSARHEFSCWLGAHVVVPEFFYAFTLCLEKARRLSPELTDDPRESCSTAATEVNW